MLSDTTWPIKKLGEVADYINGYPFSPKEWKSDGLPIIRIQNLNDSAKEYNYFSGNIDKKYLVNSGDILISWSASLGVYLWDRQNAWLNQHIFKVSVDKSIIDKDFFFFIAQTKVEEMKNKVHGGTMQHITKGVFEKIMIPVPSIQIQKKIVERLNAVRKAQELCDQQIQKTEELFESILYKELDDKKLKQLLKLEDLLEEPLKNGINFSKGQMGNGILLVNVKDIYTENEVDLDKLDRISINSREINNYSLRNDDVLFVRSSVKRDGVGYTAIFKANLSEPVVFSGFTIRARVNSKKILPQFLLYVTRSQSLRKRIIESSGTTAITNINQGSLQRLQIPTPDLKIQQKIVEKLEAVQNYKKLLLKQKSLLKELFDSVLDKSMKGELDVNN